MDIPCPVFPEFQESQCLVLLECLESLCPACHACPESPWREYLDSNLSAHARELRSKNNHGGSFRARHDHNFNLTGNQLLIVRLRLMLAVCEPLVPVTIRVA